MKPEHITIGIDNRDSTYYVARVDHSGGRPDIKALIRFDADHFNGHHLLEGDTIVVSIPDELTIVKHIQLQDSENADLKILFELETSLLESPDNFFFDVIPTKQENYYLGLIIRKNISLKTMEPFVKQNGNLKFSTQGVMRAAALARGFLTFCQQTGGDLGAIIDFGTDSASIAFYYRQQIIDLTSLSLPHAYSTDDKQFQKLIIELKTLLNFKLSSLLANGISVPLSKLYVISEFLDKKMIATLGDSLKIEIDHPEINTGFISDRNKKQEISLDKYLVALGLTVI